MKINKIKLKNFKFHHDLKFDIRKQNCLIYGENGTGKSSIYEALYSNFYYYKNSDIVNGIFDIVSRFQHRDYPENMEVNISFDNQINLNRENYEITNLEILENQTIYFANERLLREITEKDFYNVLQNILQKHFPSLNDLDRIYANWIRKLNRPHNKQTLPEISLERIELDKQFKIQFLEYIPLDMINNILINHFDEKFEIEFKFEEPDLGTKKKVLEYPKISIAVKNINDRGDFQNHFNESKLKLIGIAIYFALAKKYETKESELKLLVLDDFLTSLDMANRKLIVQYILDDFGEYQKIILTHNIQFYNLIIRLLKLRKKDDKKEELTDWDIKRLFLSNISDNPISEIKSEKSFLEQAKDRLMAGDLPSSGNLLRKEFERIVHEFEILLELGKVEDMSNILNVLKEPKLYYPAPHKTIISFITTLEKFINLERSDGTPLSSDDKLSKIEKEIEKLKASKIDLSREETLEDGVQHSLLLSLQKTNFYNGIILNPLSHDDEEKEIYRKECLNIIELLSSLDKGLNKLKGNSYT